MASHDKVRRLDCGAAAPDRISNLPINVLNLILERLPLHDAARTTILSKTWRNIWVTHPHLVFDDTFFSQLVSETEEQAKVSEASITISNILLVHSGPILKFHLSIPHNLPLLYIDLWIKNLSSRGIRELVIIRNDRFLTYKMPSQLFSCLELTHLSLSKCVLNPPLGFGGFCNLISVSFSFVTITKDISFGTRLQTLDLELCTGIEHLGCQFKFYKNLSWVMINYCGEIDWRWFECTKMVKFLDLRVGFFTPLKNKESINLYKLLGNMPKIFSLSLDCPFRKRWEQDTFVPKRLLTTMGNLKYMHLSYVDFNDVVQIQYVFCLIRSSPNLQKLDISILYPSGDDGAASSVEQYMESPELVGMVLEQLKTVTIIKMEGSTSELYFIKFLLAHSPLLRWMKLSKSERVHDPEEELEILRKVTRLPRASATSKIIWT